MFENVCVSFSIFLIIYTATVAEPLSFQIVPTFLHKIHLSVADNIEKVSMHTQTEHKLSFSWDPNQVKYPKNKIHCRAVNTTIKYY